MRSGVGVQGWVLEVLKAKHLIIKEGKPGACFLSGPVGSSTFQERMLREILVSTK